ncbi:hypothetical protein ACHAXH_002530, partial [Discostella pseudostelligera]
NTVGARRRRRPPPPRWYLLLSNPSKTTHLGTLLRCAAAFQVHQFLLVGCDKFNCRGSFGSHLFLDIMVFRSWEKVGEYLRLGGDYIDINSSDDGNCDGNKNDAQDDESTCRISQDTSGDTICRGKEDIHTSEEENVEQCRRPITIIGILGAYGGGEEIFSPDGAEVYIDEDSYVSLVPPKVVDSLNAEDNRTDAAAACLSSHSFPISARPFPSDDICFLLSKDKRGLPLSQARLCSKFIHVPHLSFDNDPSPTMQQPSHMPETNANDGIQISHSTLIDTATTLSIVLHHYTAWAGYEERSFAEDQKFVKDVKPNERRRLCRIFGDEGTRTMRHNDDESMNNFEEQYGRETLFYWNEADGDDSRGSDY